MEPVSWFALASAAVSAIGAMDSADAAASNSRAQAQAAQTNATIAQDNAHNTLLVADANEEATRRKSAYAMSQQRASLLSAGIGTDGTVADLIGQSAGNAELDALNVRFKGHVDATNYLNQGNQFLAQAGAANASASNAEDAGMYGAATSLLSGASKVKWS